MAWKHNFATHANIRTYRLSIILFPNRFISSVMFLVLIFTNLHIEFTYSNAPDNDKKNEII